jgi:glycosyltransferase involved in cell wall biosynthesis
MRPGISFFCPAYNDEKNIARTVEGVVSALEDCAQEFEVVVVEDGSPDATDVEADKLAQRLPQVRVVHHEKNRGYGGALRSGFASADQFDTVTYTDGDGQYDFREFRNLLALYDGANVVSGYRLNRADSLKRRVQTLVFGSLVRILFGLKVRDVNCSMKIYPRKMLDRISIESDSAFIDAEVLIKLSRLGVPIVQTGVHHLPRLHGKASGARLSVVTATVRDMLRLAVTRRGKAAR